MYDIIGGAQPVWLRAVMVREGDDVVTRCCVVADGQFFPIEVRVNVPALIAQARALGIEQATQDTVGGFGSWLKKAVKKVTKSKVVKAVGKAVSKVAKSPVVQIANPMAAITSHTLSKAAGGKGTIKGKAGALVDLGTKVVAPVAAPAALGFVSSRAAAALGVGMKAVQAAKAGPVIASVAKVAQQRVNLGKSAAQALAKKAVDPKKALPLVKQAASIRTNIQRIAPALAKQAVQSANVQKAFLDIRSKALAGNVDAKAAASVLARSSKLLDTIKTLEQKNAGGLPGLLITPVGRIVRSPKGRFLQSTAKGSAQFGTLYRGRNEPTLRGNFAAVSGWRAISEAVGASPGWGGDLDPGNDIDGPLYGALPSADRVQLDDYSAVHTSGVAGVLTP